MPLPALTTKVGFCSFGVHVPLRAVLMTVCPGHGETGVQAGAPGYFDSVEDIANEFSGLIAALWHTQCTISDRLLSHCQTL